MVSSEGKGKRSLAGEHLLLLPLFLDPETIFGMIYICSTQCLKYLPSGPELTGSPRRPRGCSRLNCIPTCARSCMSASVFGYVRLLLSTLYSRRWARRCLLRRRTTTGGFHFPPFLNALQDSSRARSQLFLLQGPFLGYSESRNGAHAALRPPVCGRRRKTAPVNRCELTSCAIVVTLNSFPHTGSS